MMCSTGVILSIPFDSRLSQKHKPLFFVLRDEGWSSYVPMLGPDMILEALEPQGPNVWELPSPLGTQTGELLPRCCFVSVSLVLGLPSAERDGVRTLNTDI